MATRRGARLDWPQSDPAEAPAQLRALLNDPPGNDPRPASRRLLEAVLRESIEVMNEQGPLPLYQEESVRRFASVQTILALPREGQLDVLLLCCDLRTARERRVLFAIEPERLLGYVLMHLRFLLLRRELAQGASETDELLYGVLHAVTCQGASSSDLSGLLRIAKGAVQRGLRDVLRPHAARLRAAFAGSESALVRQRRTLDDLLGSAPPADPEPGEAWSDRALADLAAMDGAERAAWSALLAHMLRVAEKSVPTREWRERARALVDAVGSARFIARFVAWSAEVRCPKALPPARGRLGTRDPIAPGNADLLRGLVWCASPLADPALDAALGALVEQTYRRIPGYGPCARKLANACLQVLGERGGRTAVAEIQRLAQRVKYAQGRALAGRILEKAAARVGLARADLEDLSVPSFGLGADGVLRRAFGDCSAELRLEGASDAALAWISADGRSRATPPKAVKKAFADAPREMRALAKSIGETLRAERDRLEGDYLSGRVHAFGSWRERWLAHPLLGRLAGSLIWTLGEGEDAREVSAVGGLLQTLDGRDAGAPDPGASVRLWHPIEAEVETVLAWRRRLAALGVCQPFKQAHREVYLLTPAERETGTYSNRFAAHILKQHQLAALCRARGWRYQLQGNFDSWNAPTRALPHGLQLQFHLDPVTEYTSASAIFLYLSSDRVCFLEGEGAPVELARVPPLVFSEAMREVDLFVGVASVGADPNWNDGGDQPFGNYWRAWAFGDLGATARTRREVLEELLPSLAIAPRCRLGERFLEVDGDLASYRIHLGSGCVQIEPGSRYLCIVRDSRGSLEDRLALPFEGDGTLSLILSKAILLADDASIRDPSILAQIRQH